MIIKLTEAIDGSTTLVNTDYMIYAETEEVTYSKTKYVTKIYLKGYIVKVLESTDKIYDIILSNKKDKRCLCE